MSKEMAQCNNCGLMFFTDDLKMCPANDDHGEDDWLTPCCGSSDYDIIGDINE